MRIAVCYSGAFRTFPKCYDKNHEMLSKLGELDYYISTWQLPGYTKVARFDDVLAIDGDTIYPELPPKDFIITEEYLRGFLQFKNIDIEPMSRMDEVIKPYKERPWYIMNPCRLVSQYYKLERCFELLACDYDMVIRIRPDIKIGRLPENIDVEGVYIPSMVYNTEPSIKSGMINEMFYISNYKNMGKICSIYNDFDKIWSQHDAYGERMSFLNFERYGLLDVSKPFDFDITVTRENGNDEYIR